LGFYWTILEREKEQHLIDLWRKVLGSEDHPHQALRREIDFLVIERSCGLKTLKTGDNVEERFA